MANDCCNIVKALLKAWAFTRYITAFSIYIKNEDIYEGGAIPYMTLEGGTRNPIRALNCFPIYKDKTCVLKVYTRNSTDRDNLDDDIEDMFFASNYTFNVKNKKDNPYAQG